MGDEGKTTASRAGWLSERRGAAEASPSLALVVAWSQSEPARTGEFALLREGDDRSLGRGEAKSDDPLPRVELGRLRPSGFRPTGPLVGPRISRHQLRVRAEGGAVRFERLGRCPVLVRGARVDKGALRPGDTLLLEDELLLLCVLVPDPPSHGEIDERHAFGEPDAHGLVGESAAAWTLRAEIAFLGRAGGHVLVVGASGVGKELAARALHERSSRARGPFVARNAATLPAALVDAELFGHAKNYPTAPMPERRGLLGEADGGTLFLDEVGELPPEQQAHLLRVLDSGGEYHRLGESETRRADVRLVAATNRDESTLKHDFAARFPLRLRVPGLDARPEDVPLLVRHVLRRAARRDRSLGPRFFEGWGGETPEPRIDPRLVDRLLGHVYTGHVRELESILWQAMAKSPGSFLAATPDLEERLDAAAPKKAVRPDELSRERIEEVLAACGGSQEKAFRELGLASRDVLYRLMKKLGIKPR